MADNIQQIISTEFSNSNDIDIFFRTYNSTGFVDWWNNTQSRKGYFATYKDDSGRTRSARGPIKDNTAWSSIWNNIPTLFGKNSINLLEFLAINTIMVNESPSFHPSTERVGTKGHVGIAYAFDKISGIKRSYNVLKTNKTAFDNFNDPLFIQVHGNLPFASKYKNTTDTAWQGESFPPGGNSPEAGKNTNGGDISFLTEADFHKFRGRGFIQTTGREVYKPLISKVLEYSGNNSVLNTIKSRWNKYGSNLDKIATASTNKEWDDLFQKTGGYIANAALWSHAERTKYSWISARQSEGAIRSQVRNVAFKIAGGGAKAYASVFENRFYQQLNLLLNREPDALPPEANDGATETQNTSNELQTNENANTQEPTPQNYPDDLPKVEGLTNFFRPSIQIDPIKFDMPADPAVQENLSNTVGYVPFVWYYSYQLRFIKSFTLSSTGIAPKCRLVFTDDLNLMTDKGFPLDNSVFKIFVNSRTPSLRPIMMEFKITHFSRTGDNDFVMEGVCNIDKLFIREFESFSNMTSFKCMQEWAKSANLGFNSNVSESNDKMTWINPGVRGVDFLEKVTKNAYRNDEGFIWIYIDYYYNLNYIDVEESLKIDISNQTQVSSSGMKELTEGNVSTDEKEQTSSLLITNDPAFDQSNVYFMDWRIMNNSTKVSLMNGYLNKVKFYDIKDKNYLIFDVDSITSEGDKTIILKGSPQDMDFYDKNVRTTYTGILDQDNMHFNFNYSKVQNEQNIIDLQKIGIELIMKTPNYNLYRYQKVNVNISQAISTPSTAQYNGRLSGEWLIISISYDMSPDGGYRQKVTLIRRELSLSEEELNSEAPQEQIPEESGTQPSENDTPETEEEDVIPVEEEEIEETNGSDTEFSYDLKFTNANEIDAFFKKYDNGGYVDFVNNNFGNSDLFTNNVIDDYGDGDINGNPTETDATDITTNSGEEVRQPINRERWNKLWNSAVKLIYNKDNNITKKEFNIVEFLCLSTMISYMTKTKYDIITDNRDINEVFVVNNINQYNKTAFDNFNSDNYNAVNSNAKFYDILNNTSNTVWKYDIFPFGFSGQGIDAETSKINNEYLMNSDFYKFRSRSYISFSTRKYYNDLVSWIKVYNGVNKTILDYKQQYSPITNNDVILDKMNDRTDVSVLFKQDEVKHKSLGINMFNLKSVHIIPTENRSEDKILKSIENFGKIVAGSLEYTPYDFVDRFVKQVAIQIDYLQGNNESVKSSESSSVNTSQTNAGGKNPKAILSKGADISKFKSGGKFDAYSAGKKTGKLETIVYKSVLVSSKIAPYLIDMINDAKKDGITLSLNSAFRTNEDQVINGQTRSGQWKLYDKYQHSKGKHYTYKGHSPNNPPISSKGNLAAYPGRSNHQSGIAVDLSPTRKGQSGYDWLVQNAWKYGFIRSVKKERWHWKFSPGSRMFDKVASDHPTWDSLPSKYGLI